MFHEQALRDDSSRSHHHKVQAPSIAAGAMCTFGHDLSGRGGCDRRIAMTRTRRLAYWYFMRRMAGGVAFQDEQTSRMTAHDMKINLWSPPRMC